MPDPCEFTPPKVCHPTTSNTTFDTLLERHDTDVRRAAKSRARAYRLQQDFICDLEQGARVALLRSSLRYGTVPEQLARTVISNSITSVASTEKKFGSGVPVSDHEEDQANWGNHTAGFSLIDDSTRPDAHGDHFVISRVRLAIGKLAPHLQRVYKALYVDGLTQRELAEDLRVSQPRVAKLHRRLLQECRTALTQ